MKQRISRQSNLENGFIRNSHYLLLLSCAFFILAALVLGEWMGMYNAVWWWDDMLHGLSGVIVGLIGLLGVYFFNARHSMAISPSLVGVFVFCFATTIGVLWEIYEFTIDVFLKGTMQQWNMPPNAIVMGQSYQGMGLRDTMSDLILACIGGLIVAIFAFFVYKYRRPTVLKVMQRAFPWLHRRTTRTRT